MFLVEQGAPEKREIANAKEPANPEPKKRKATPVDNEGPPANPSTPGTAAGSEAAPPLTASTRKGKKRTEQEERVVKLRAKLDTATKSGKMVVSLI